MTSKLRIGATLVYLDEPTPIYCSEWAKMLVICLRWTNKILFFFFCPFISALPSWFPLSLPFPFFLLHSMVSIFSFFCLFLPFHSFCHLSRSMCSLLHQLGQQGCQCWWPLDSLHCEFTPDLLFNCFFFLSFVCMCACMYVCKCVCVIPDSHFNYWNIESSVYPLQRLLHPDFI